MSSSGLDTAAGDVLAIALKGEVDFGMTLSPDREGCAAIITGWKRLYNGKFGPIQKHGGVHIGDALFAINDTSLLNTPHEEVVAMLQNPDIINKTLRFHNIGEHYSKKRNLGIGSAIINAAKEANKPAFASAVRRSRISSSDDKPFVEYEISCKLRLPTSIQGDENISWTVWKRYSEFEALDGELRRALGWQMDAVTLPSSHTLVFNKLSETFVEQRRRDLDAYWQSVIQLDKLVEFHKHHCSAELKAFLKVDEKIIAHKSGIKETDPSFASTSAASSASSSPAAVDASAPGQRPPMRRQGSSIRRLSAKPSDLATASAAMNASASAPPPPGPFKASSSASSSAAASSVPATDGASEGVTAAPPVAAARALDEGVLPPKASGARANLLGDIARLRKE